MSIYSDEALNNAKKFVNKIVFIDDREKSNVNELITNILDEIKVESLNGKINYSISIQKFKIAKEEHLKYIVFHLREYNFLAYVDDYDDIYLLNVYIPL